jgi:hypothetical protein
MHPVSSAISCLLHKKPAASLPLYVREEEAAYMKKTSNSTAENADGMQFV